MSSFFISDLHLSEKTPEIFRGFQLFLNQHAKNADALYILGDFFDAWIGDDEDADFANEIRKALKDYVNAGTPTFFIHGNRDFLVGERFAEETGVELLPEHCVIDCHGEPVLIMHGDTLCTGDEEYMKFRAMVRAPQWQQQVLSLPLDQRRMMAADLRSKSLSLNAMKAEDIMDVTHSEALNAFNTYNTKIIIHGHTHRPNSHEVSLENDEVGRRIVLGDWSSTKGWFVKANKSGFNLEQFSF